MKESELGSDYANPFLCYTGLNPLLNTLCEPGDEGSPLLCKPHEGSKLPKNEKHTENTNIDRKKKSVKGGGKTGKKIRETDDKKKKIAGGNARGGNGNIDDGAGGDGGRVYANDGLSLYGIGVLPDISSCKSTSSTKNVMFLYMLKYGAWIHAVLKDFDEHEREENKTATLDEMITQTTTTTTTTTIPLPDYYDTKLYDDISKRPIQCKNTDRSHWFNNRRNKADRFDGGPASVLVLSSLMVIAVTVSMKIHFIHY